MESPHWMDPDVRGATAGLWNSLMWTPVPTTDIRVWRPNRVVGSSGPGAQDSSYTSWVAIGTQSSGHKWKDLPLECPHPSTGLTPMLPQETNYGLICICSINSCQIFACLFLWMLGDISRQCYVMIKNRTVRANKDWSNASSTIWLWKAIELLGASVSSCKMLIITV